MKNLNLKEVKTEMELHTERVFDLMDILDRDTDRVQYARNDLNSTLKALALEPLDTPRHTLLTQMKVRQEKTLADQLQRLSELLNSDYFKSIK